MLHKWKRWDERRTQIRNPRGERNQPQAEMASLHLVYLHFSAFLKLVLAFSPLSRRSHSFPCSLKMEATLSHNCWSSADNDGFNVFLAPCFIADSTVLTLPHKRSRALLLLVFSAKFRKRPATSTISRRGRPFRDHKWESNISPIASDCIEVLEPRSQPFELDRICSHARSHLRQASVFVYNE